MDIDNTKVPLFTAKGGTFLCLKRHFPVLKAVLSDASNGT